MFCRVIVCSIHRLITANCGAPLGRPSQLFAKNGIYRCLIDQWLNCSSRDAGFPNLYKSTVKPKFSGESKTVAFAVYYSDKAVDYCANLWQEDM